MLSSSDDAIPFQIDQPTLEEITGLYLFNQKELAVYLDMKAASKEMSLTKKEQRIKRSNAGAKLRKVIEQRMPAAEREALEAARPVAKLKKVIKPRMPMAEKIQLIKKALSIATPKERESYDTYLVGATNPEKTPEQQRMCTTHAMQKLRLIVANQADEEKRTAMNSEELQEYDNDPERVAANAEKTRYRLAVNTKHREKEAALCNAGDPDALARKAAANESTRKWNAAAYQRKKEEEAKTAKIFPKSVRNSTVFGEGDARQESLTRKVEEIMGSHAGSVHLSGIPTSKKWVNDHGDVSVGDKLAEGEFAAYLGITRTTVDPGNEQECRETKAFITDVGRDPLWRIEQEDGDLKRMSPLQAKSVVNVYLLAKYDNPYDVTSLEGMCQFYLENELGLPHGICLHKQAGAGKRLKDSMTAAEYKLFRSGKLKGWSLTLTMIRTTDRVFADSDPDDPERSPPLIAASVPTHDGTGTVYRIRIGGKKQRFPDTPSVVKDRATNKVKNERTKARRQKRKRGAAEPSDTAESPEDMEEETVKKSKIEVVEGVE
jgi:hypothetical protein